MVGLVEEVTEMIIPVPGGSMEAIKAALFALVGATAFILGIFKLDGRLEALVGSDYLEQWDRLGNHFCIIVASGASVIVACYWLSSEVAEGMRTLTITLVAGFVAFVSIGIVPLIYSDIRDWLRVPGESD